ncbi:HEXXH motif-containing putative peptide modification protein [Rothia sp. ARF10]|nr:HEXXH motif-containing putative peptide modification protein [Rothia sp. ARF10]
MSSPPGEITGLTAVEQRLAHGTPFGSHEFMSTRVSRVYVQLLSLLAETSSGARRLGELLHGLEPSRQQVVLRDSLLRRTIEDGTGTVVQGVDSIDPALLDDLLGAAAEAAASDQVTLLADPALSVVFAERVRGDGHVWLGSGGGSLAGARFEDQVVRRLPRFGFHTPSEEQVEVLRAGNRLASLVAPDLADSTVAHACVVVVGDFDGAEHLFSALTLPGLAGVIVLSPHAIRTDIDVAETLVHESTHLKFLDLDYISPLFVRGFRPERSPLVTPSWHEDDPVYGGWPVDRVLTSMHVYLTLCVFFGHAAAEVREGEWTADYAVSRVEQCRTRAAWLFEAAHRHLEFLTPAGRDFVASIGEMLEELPD